MKNFRPSDVRVDFHSSVFKNLEKEILMAQIVAFLARHGDDWNMLISHSQFEDQGTNYNSFAVSVYNRPLQNLRVRLGYVTAFHYFAVNGYVKVDYNGNFRITQKLIDVYAHYI